MADTIKILGQQGGDDYSTTADAIAAIPANIVTHGGDNWVIRVRADADYDGFIMPDVVTDATHKLIFEAFPGDEVDGTGTGARFKAAYTGGVGQKNGLIGRVPSQPVTSRYVFRNLLIENTALGEPAIAVDEIGTLELENCFLRGRSSPACLQTIGGAGGAITVTNCIFHATDGASATSWTNIPAGMTVTFNGLTIVGTGSVGLDDRNFGTAASLSATNVFIYGFTTCFDTKWDQSISDYFASSDSTAAEAGGTAGVNYFTGRTTADFENFAGGNFNLAAGSALKGAGASGADIGATLGVSGSTTVDESVSFAVRTVHVSTPAAVRSAAAAATTELAAANTASAARLAAVTSDLRASTSTASTVDVVATVTAGVRFTPTAATAVVVNATITEAPQFAASATGTVDAAAEIDESVAYGLSLSGTATVQAQAVAAIASALGLTQLGAVTVDANVSVANAAQLNQALTGAATANTATTTPVEFTPTAAGTVDTQTEFNSAVSYSVRLGALAAAQAQAAVAVAPATTLNAQLAAAAEALVAATAGVALGAQATAGLTYTASVAVGSELATQLDAVAAAAASAVMTQELATAVIVEALAQAGVNFANIHNVTFSGTSIAADYTTPEGRVYTVRAETRAYTVEVDVRTYTVKRPDRAYTVKRGHDEC